MKRANNKNSSEKEELVRKRNFLEGLREELECRICLQVASSPIYTCTNGHITCGFCFQKLTSCGVCKAKFNLNSFAELLSKKYELTNKCINSSAGCSKIIKCADMKNHLATLCEFRPIKCIVNPKGYCYKTFFDLKNFFQHTIDVHKNPIIPNGEICRFSLHFCDSRFDEINFRWVYYSFEDVTIALIAVVKYETLFWWAVLPSGSEKASQYSCKTATSKQNGTNKNCVWKLPVLPIHKYIDDEEMIKSGHVGSIYSSVIKNVADREIATENGKEYEIYFKVEISKVAVNTERKV